MGKRKNLTVMFLYMEPGDTTGKDLTCVPWYLARELGMEPEIVSLTTPTNRELPAEENGVKYTLLYHRNRNKKGWWKLIFFWWYILWNARKVDVMVWFHYFPPTIVEVALYKMFNPRGKAYVKCDMGAENFMRCDELIHKFGPVMRWIAKKAARSIDVISSETERAYTWLRTSNSPWFSFGNKLVFVPNGFDEQALVDSGLDVKSFAQKENAMITVGRLGTIQKNTEMLLDALAQTEMKGWKFYAIGPVDTAFQPTIDRFFEEHPEKRESVIFTGPIYDKKELWEYYNRAKVFVLPSRWEGYAIVFSEAKRFGCYVVATDVGGARETIQDDKYGEYVNQDDAAGLSTALQRIIDGKTNVDVYKEDIAREISWEHVLKPVVEKLKG